jgi:hypothetical protein
MSVATLTKTLVVNPAFLQEIKDSNPDVWNSVSQLQEISQVVDEPTRILRQLTRLLDDLRDQLALQFSLGESYGYIEVPERVVGHSSRVTTDLANQTQSQHSILYLRLSDLAEQAEELQYRGVEPQRLRELVVSSGQFYLDLREHEQMENELIRRSYDVG